MEVDREGVTPGEGDAESRSPPDDPTITKFLDSWNLHTESGTKEKLIEKNEELQTELDKTVLQMKMLETRNRLLETVLQEVKTKLTTVEEPSTDRQ